VARTASARGTRSEGNRDQGKQTRAQQRAAGTKNTALFDIVNTAAPYGSCASRGSACLNRLILRDGEAVVSKDGAAPVDLRALMVRDAPKALLTM